MDREQLDYQEKNKEDEEAIKNFWKEQKQINDLNNGRDKDK